MILVGPWECHQCSWRCYQKGKPCPLQRFQTHKITARFSGRQQVTTHSSSLLNIIVLTLWLPEVIYMQLLLIIYTHYPVNRWWEYLELSCQSCHLDLIPNSRHWFTRKILTAREENWQSDLGSWRVNLLNKWAQQYSDQRSLKLSSVAWCNIVFSNYLWMRCWFMKQICLPQNQSEWLLHWQWMDN